MNPVSIEDTLYQIDELLNDTDSANDTRKAIGGLIIAISHLKDVVEQSLELTAQNEQPIHGDVSVSARLGELHSAASGCANAAHASHNANEPESHDTGRGA